jgi:hypothetical protein
MEFAFSILVLLGYPTDKGHPTDKGCWLAAVDA